MPLAVTRDELQNLLFETPFTRSLGYAVKSIADGEAVIEIPFRPESERPGGIVSGQVYMNAADVAVWLAIKTRLGLDDGSVTLEMKTSFLRPAVRETIECRARILQLRPPHGLCHRGMRQSGRQAPHAPHAHLPPRVRIRYIVLPMRALGREFGSCPQMLVSPSRMPDREGHCAPSAAGSI